MKKLLASDFDGTWKTSKKAMQKNISTLNLFQKDHLFGFVTGRNVDYMNHRCASMKIKYDFLVACNGAYCCVKDQVKTEYIEESLVSEIYKLVQEKVMSFSLFTANTQHEPVNRRPLFKKIRVGYKRYFSEKETMNKTFTNQEVMMIECQGQCPESTSQLRALIEERYGSLVSIAGDKTWFDITPLAAHKKEGMRWIAEQLNLSAAALVTVGDGENDLEMLKAFKGYRISKPGGYLEDKIGPKVNEVYELMQLMMSERIG